MLEQQGEVNRLTTEVAALTADRDRLREGNANLALKGPCRNKCCCLHYAHSGPCDTTAAYAGGEGGT